ncbi:MAG: M4 family metallopeptidase [Chloroflexi bacterium]|nr:M4 family metallopeptidase [Chloroflexota bacterium]MCI0579083.1 M4 family metallopeptidase [Chloroflexota bacterium]MCI0644062.1 M4 family metallopeptidase [Chloroflexota bacterium]MCI0727878.1 M4 family metallopeptidase [Chloroflexota bacterium]
MKPKLNRPLIIIAAVLALLLSGFLTIGQAAQDDPTREELLDQLETTTGGRLTTGSHWTAASRGLSNLTMIRATGGALLAADNVAAPPEARALAFLESYGLLLGVVNPAAELQAKETLQDELGTTHVRLDQVYQAVPVFGTQVIVHMNGRGITGANGFFIPGIALDTTPTLAADQAVQSVVAALSKEVPGVTAAVQGLYVYRTGLLEGYAGENRLAYAVTAEAEGLHEQVWLDAHSGAILNRIPLDHDGLHRIVYSPIFDPSNPELFVVREEGDPPTLVPPFDNLYDFAGQVYNLFFNAFGRDSYDGNGIPMRSVYLVNQVCPNAYWNGQATHYCPGFDLDDVVAHEWGHAYTQYTHGLIYQWQSGALNESYSDIWGETLDLHNGRDGIGGSNNDEPYPAGQRWIMGEDLTDPVVTLLLRDMWDPERLGSPAKVSSANYYCGTGDGGGVHTNSGVPNHAFAMLVDGKSFNGQTVIGLGSTKAVHIYWRAASVYQTPTTFFPEHADALEAACTDLVGLNLADFQTGLPSGEVITQADCQQVANAMLAVEMRQEPTQCNFQPLLDPNAPAMCDTASLVFSEDWESGMDGWGLTSQAAPPPRGDAWPNYNWELSSSLPSGHSGTGAFAFNDRGGTCAPGGDISGHFTIDSPLFTVPDPLVDLELRFNHWVATEANWDGGNLKASVNGGPYVLVPEEAFLFNPYNATLNDAVVDGNTNPLAGEGAWSGSDGGQLAGSWGTTIVDLAALNVSSGDTVQLRWDFGTDGCNGLVGWYLDDVQVYTCQGPAPTPTPTATPVPTVTPTPAPAGDEATGGGWLQTNNGRKINFGFHVEATAGGLAGDLQLNDKESKVKVRLTQVTFMGDVAEPCGSVPAGPNALEFQGTGKFNETGNATFRVCVQDNAEPGQGYDLLYLECLSGCNYNTAGSTPDDVIDNGNIQVERAAGGGGSGEPAPATLILQPILLDKGAIGQLQLFTVIVYDQDQNVLPNAAVTLTRVTAGGTTESFTAITDLAGLAVFSLVNLNQVTEYTASAGSVTSNAVEVRPLLP